MYGKVKLAFIDLYLGLLNVTLICASILVVLSRVSEYSYASLLHCQIEYTLLDSIKGKQN